ncbi:MAG: hypothetical protein AAGF47_01620 [Planctomycetota bacterium]
MPSTPRSRLLVTAAAAAAITGCASDDNARLVIGDDVALASLPPMVAEPALDAEGTPLPNPTPKSDAPSALGIDRSNFEPSVYRVPIDGTRHQPQATAPLRMTSDTARQRGEFPTIRSALEPISRANKRTQAFEIFVAPCWAFIDLLITPAQLVIDPAYETVSSPTTLPGRTPSSDRAGAPGVLPLTRAELDAKLFDAKLHEGEGSGDRQDQPSTGGQPDA